MPSDERAQAERIAEGDHAVLGHDDRAVGALDAADDVHQRVLDRLRLVGGEQRGDDLASHDVERNVTPFSRSSACSSTTLTRLPLWPSATSRLSARQTGCEFSHEFAPVVQ